MEKSLNKKKILFVLQSLRMGGAERLQVTIANKLVKAGYDVTILIWKPMYNYRDNLDPRVRLIYKAPDEHLGNRIPYIRYKFYDDCMWEMRASPRQLYRYYVGHEKYDVEIAFFHGLALDIVGGSTNKKAKKIAWVHLDMNRTDFNAAQKKAIEMYRRIHNIVCVTQSSRKSFIEKVGDSCDVRVINNMMPIEEILQKKDEPPAQAVKKAKMHLVIVARLHAPKGHLRLISAVAKLRGEGRDLSLAIVGAGDEEQIIRDAIRSHGLQDAITMVDGKNNPYPYISEADLLVCSSLTEGYNLTIAEALILGVPVLSTDCAGPRDILDNGKYGMIVENSEEGLYQGLKRLYDDPALLKEYRNKAHERMDYFDEDKILKQITELIEG